MLRPIGHDSLVAMQTTGEESTEPCANLGLGCEWIYEATGNEIFAEVVSWLIGTPLKVAIIVIAAMLLNRWLHKRISEYGEKLGGVDLGDALVSERSVERSRERAATLTSLARSATSLVVYGLAAIMVLEVIGFGVITAIAGAGVAGLAIAFGAQSVVEDMLKGFFMIFEDQFGVGDRINVGSVEGYVERVTLRTTVVRDPDGRVWHVPNSEIDWVANETQNWSRAKIEIGVSYDTDLRLAGDIVERAALELAEEDPWADHIQDGPNLMGVQELGDDAVILRVDTRIDPDRRRAFERALSQHLLEVLEAAGIEMPFRTYDVWLRSEPEAA